jgi:hypothetical protein
MPDPNDEFDLPRLAGALRATYAHQPEIPRSLDETIASAARAHFARRRQLRLVARWGTGLAAGIAALIMVVIFLHRPSASTPLAHGGQPLNMVDALKLAKHLANHDNLDPSWDVNHDKVVDDNDVQAIATAAVSLKQKHLALTPLPTLNHLGISHPIATARTPNTSSLSFSGVPEGPLSPRKNKDLPQ